MHTHAKILTLIAVFSTLFVLPVNLIGQTGGCADPVFQLDFHGQDQNFTISCGKIFTQSKWQVSNETCLGVTDKFALSQASCSDPNNMSEINMRLGKTGSAGNGDYHVIKIYCGGVLVEYDSIPGDWPSYSGNSNTRTMTYTVPCAYPDSMHIEVIMSCDNNNEEMQLFSAESCVNCFVPPNLLPIYISNEQLVDRDDEVALSFDLLIDNPQFKELEQSNLSLLRSSNGSDFEAVEFSFSEQGDQITLVDEFPSINKPYYKATVSFMDEEPKSTRVLKRNRSVESNKIYPNPNTGNRINIAYSEKIESVVISDATGKEVERISPEDNEKSLQIETQNPLSTGMYYVTINSQISSATYPLLVK